MIWKYVASIVVAATGLFGAGAGLAQQPGSYPMPPMAGLPFFAPGLPPPPPFAGPGPGAGNALPAGPSPKEVCMNAVALRAGFLGYLKAKLDLAPPQLAAWQEAEAVFNDVAKGEREGCSRLPAEVAQASVLRAIAFAEEYTASQQQQLQKTGPAIRKLYESLSASQRKVMDSIPPPMMF